MYNNENCVPLKYQRGMYQVIFIYESIQLTSTSLTAYLHIAGTGMEPNLCSSFHVLNSENELILHCLFILKSPMRAASIDVLWRSLVQAFGLEGLALERVWKNVAICSMQ